MGPSLVAALCLLHLTAAQTGLFPPTSDLALNRPISSTSTCGSSSATNYCQFSTDFTKSFSSCQTAVCNATCPHGDTLPSVVDVLSGATIGQKVAKVNKRPGSPSNVKVALYFLASTTSYVLPEVAIPDLSPNPGFTITVWMFPLVSSRGAILSKTRDGGNTRIYTLRVLRTTINFDYLPVGVSSGYKTVTVRSSAVKINQWNHVAVTVYKKNIAFYVNGKLEAATTLQDSVSDGTGDIVVGQVFRGSSTTYRGQMQELYLYTEAVSERSIQEIYSGHLPLLSRFHTCRCPPSHPLVDTSNELICTSLAGHPFSMTSRINLDAHPVEYATDPDSLTRWQSEVGQPSVTLTIDFEYGEVEVMFMIAQFYTPRPKAMVLEKSRDGQTFSPLQYYADDCQRYFGLPNDGPLATATDINCITTYSKQSPPSQSQVAFRLIDPSRPQVTNYDHLPALRDLAYSSSVRLRMVDYFLNQTSPGHRYYGIIGLRVLGRCECSGHATNCVADDTQQKWVCTCQHFTKGHQCTECEPLYNNKPWRRGTTSLANACVPCQCNGHATSCHYNRTLDLFPDSHTKGGGGVCDTCMHNTTGIHCDQCVDKFFRPSGRGLNATDVCVSCDCHLPGVVNADEVCVKDDSDSLVAAGQCHCKQFVTGRQCDSCQSGYFNLNINNARGCEECKCNASGTISGRGAPCDQLSGQCQCKRNVIGTDCDQCQNGTHSLSASNPDGCIGCNCNVNGTIHGSMCNIQTGQCQCKVGVTGLKCDQCQIGFYNMSSSGCDQCQCNSAGIRSSSGGSCDQVTGQCDCKPNIVGLKCDMCDVGFYIRDLAKFDGCVACNCNTNGTVAASPSCSSDGLCMCKALVTGQKCDTCVSTTYGLSASNSQGCTSCGCSSRGSVAGGTCNAVSGQCDCLPNVMGQACDSCSTGFYLAPNDQSGCLPCNCHPQGSRGSSCHPLTGQCSCLNGVGIAGRACDSCVPGFFGFSGTSCQSCNCDAAGSLSTNCHQTSGQCSCKQYVEGSKCDRCIAGFSFLQASNVFGCSAPPEEQGPPTLLALNGSTARLSWQLPEKPNGQIIFYLGIRNGSIVFNTTVTTFTDNSVIPITTYKYEIQAHTVVGSTTSASVTIRTPEGPPGGVAPPRLSVVGPSSIVSSWSVPAMPNGQITKYVLVQVHPNGQEVNLFQGVGLHFTITGLMAFTQYSFKLRACTMAGCRDSSIASETTLEGRPAFQPAPVALHVLPMELTIGWVLPSQPNGILAGFRVYRKDVPFAGNERLIYSTSDINMNTTTATGLLPYTEYDFAVESFTSAGATRSSYARLRAGQTAPQGVFSPRVQVTGAFTVRITWEEPSVPNGLITSYHVYQSGSPDILLHHAGRIGSFVVAGLLPFTTYSFYIEVCTQGGCTNSSQTANSTFEAEPQGQTPPVVSSINATSALLTWQPPAVTNGLIRSYTLQRLAAPFDDRSAVPGMYFLGNGYAVITNPVFYGGFESTISFYFRTHYLDGLLFYSGDSLQQDFIGIQLSNGQPYFLFNCGSGAAVIALQTTVTFNDGLWHKLVAYRRGSSGVLTLDDSLIGRGNSQGSASVVGRNTGVQLGGVASPFSDPFPGHTANFPLTAASFAGSLRDLYFTDDNNIVQANLSNLFSSSNVIASSEGCPVSTEQGMHFKGGGHVKLSASKVAFSSADVEIIFNLRTTQQTALLLFGHGNSPSFFSLEFVDGELVFQFNNGGGKAVIQTALGGTRITLCDGKWHTIQVIKQGRSGELFIDGDSVASLSNASGSQQVLEITSNIFVGGVNAGSTAYDVARMFGVQVTSFAGCLKNVTIAGRHVNVAADVADLSLASLAGCPDTAVTSVSCTDGLSTVFMGNKTVAEDLTIKPFTEYLYRLASSNHGGSSYSRWISVRSKEAAPTGIPHPILSYSGGSSVQVKWSYPSPSNGIVTQYRLLLYPYNPRSQGSGPTVAPPTEIVINDVFATSHVVTGLAPYIQYQVVLEATNLAGTATGPAASVITSEATPTGVQPVSVVSQSRSLNFTWSEPTKPNGIILYYTLAVNSHVFFNGSMRHYLLASLTPFTDYSAQLSACNSAGCGFGALQTVSTAEAPPEGVQAAKLVVQGAQSVFATWNEPTTKNGIIVLYEVHLARGSLSSRVVYNGTAHQATITNLVAGTTYSFQVKAFTSAGGALGPSSSVRTLDDVPEGVRQPQAVAINATAVMITWQSPQTPNGDITEYVLLEDEQEIFRGLAFTYVSSILSPYTIYEYKIQACTTEGCGTSAPMSVRTLEATPEGQPTPRIQFVTATSVQIVIGEPKKPNGAVLYRLFVSGEVSVSPNQIVSELKTFIAHTGSSGVQSILVGKLLPYSNYTFFVEVANSAGSTNSSTVTVETLPDAPYGVSTPTVRTINATSIRITWLEPGRVNGKLLSYVVKLFELGTASQTLVSVNTGLKTEALISNLKPFTVYNITVNVTTNGGSTVSAATAVRTSEAAPVGLDQPTVVEVRSTSLLLDWDTPSSPNGIIIQHRVLINGTGGTSEAGSQSRTNVTGLLPFTVYLVEVETCNSVGCVRSDSVTVRTAEAAPAGVSAPILTSVSARSVVVRWNSPSFSNGIILFYHIQRLLANSSSVPVSVSKLSARNLTTLQYLDNSRHLNPFTVYFYRIVAENSAGMTPSPYANVTTREAAPAGVIAPTVKLRSSSALDVTWNAPLQPNGIVVLYELKRIQAGSSQVDRRQYNSNRFGATATGLQPYTNYTFTLTACTAAGCTESSSVSQTTDEALATGLVAPVVSPLNPESPSRLFVFWSSPAEPNGVLIRYELHRRNLDVSTNGSSLVFERVILSDPKVTSVIDSGLNVYSRYQYEVTFVNGAGSTRSASSSIQRTGPDTPLAGPTVSATVVNHTTVLVQWTPPGLNLVRGPVLNYDLFVKAATDINRTIVSSDLRERRVVTDLMPNTDYEFTVRLDNGVGTATSNIATARTLDGRPEGVQPPSLQTLSSVSVRITWMEPSMPNGRILLYVVYRDGTKIHNSTSPSSFVASNLKPATSYRFTVEVCTVFDCVTSDSATTTTNEDLPEGLTAPVVTVLGARSVNVSWSPPSQPNGQIITYFVYRRPYELCIEPTDDPTATPTKEQCTYVECSLLTQSHCGTACYDPSTETCCEGTVHDSQVGFACCRSNYTQRSNALDVCCGGIFHSRQAGFGCCGTDYVSMPSGTICCDGVVGRGDMCCGTSAFDTSTQVCCGGLLRTAHVNVKCCGDNIVLKSKVCCGGTAYDYDENRVCCGSQYVVNSTSLCCVSTTGAARSYVYRSAAAKSLSAEVCCGTVKIRDGAGCCNEVSYDLVTQTCADRSTVPGSSRMCGTGTVCLSDQSGSAYCDRCDFDLNSLSCGTVDGKHLLRTTNVSSTVAPTPAAPRLCPGLLQFVASVQEMSHVDNNLSPYTRYDFQVVAFNSIGNVSSPVTSQTTSQASPDGLSGPILTASSSSSINIKWMVPTEPNGLITSYTVFRNGQKIHQSLDFTFSDLNLRPYTSYTYLLEVCTTGGCTNSSSASALTLEDKPVAVDFPVTVAVSSTAIHVRWRAPVQPNGVITEYRLYQDAAPNPVLSGLDTSYNATGLLPYTTHTFVVAACTGAGCTRSDSTSSRTLEAAPEGVNAPRVTALSPTTIDVQWEIPSSPNGRILQYSLLRNGIVIFNGTDLSLTDTKRTPNVAYTYRIRVTTGGGSTTSAGSTVTTPEDVPDGLAVPRLSSVNSTAIEAQWSAPTQPNGVIIRYVLYVDGSATQAALQTTLIAGGFEPFTTHEFQVEACNGKGCARSQRVTATTLEAAPEGMSPPVVIALGPTFVQVSWSPPLKPNGIINRYEVYRKAATSGAPELIVCASNNISLLTCSNSDSQLQPYSVYRYRVRANNGAGNVYSAYAFVRTLEAIPAGLAAPTVVVVSSSKVNTTWIPPSSPNGVILFYLIRHRLFLLDVQDSVPKVAANVSANTMHHVVSGLEASTDYELQVVAYNGAGAVESPWQLATTQEGCPEQLQPITANADSSGTALFLTWAVPLKPNGAITVYRIYADTVYTVSSRMFDFRRLTPFTAYQFQLEACTTVCCARGQNQSIATAEVTPIGQPAPQLVASTSSQVSVQWQPPSSPNGIIVRYSIYRRQPATTPGSPPLSTPTIVSVVNVTNVSRALSYLDTGLQSFTTYQYSVFAENSVGGVQSSYAEVRTLQAPPGGVTSPRVVSRTATSVSLSWQRPTQPNGIISRYDVLRNNSVILSTVSTTFNDTALLPFTIYSYAIAACSAGGCTQSSISIAITREAPPAVVLPPTLYTVNSSAIYANWSYPLQPNGILTEFLIEYTSVAQRSVGLRTDFVAMNLAPFSLYSFRLTACTGGGCTTSSEAIGRSGAAAPQGLASPTLSVVGSESIEVMWSSPTLPNGIIDTYHLLRNGSVIYIGKDVRFRDSGLRPGETYAYSVQATTVGGGTTESSMSVAATNPDAPGGLLAPKVVPISSTNVTVTWLPPASPNGVIVSYQVLVDSVIIVNASVQSFRRTITGLAFFSLHSFQIRACTARGCSTSDATVARTLEAAPTGQKSPALVATDRNVSVSWTVPDMPNGIIVLYEVYRRLAVSGNQWKLVYNGTDTFYVDTESVLIPFTRYEYRVTAYNSISSTSSPPTPVRLEESQPESIPTPLVYDIGQNSFRVTVQNPLLPNGIIILYNVIVNGSVVDSDVQRNFTVTQLHPFTLLQVRSQACTSAGCGSSDSVYVRTGEAPPQGLDPPRSTQTNSRDVVLSWAKPSEPNGIITGYIVLRRTACPQPEQPFLNQSACVLGQVEEVFRSRRKRSTDKEIITEIISNLRPYTSYQFLVRSENSAGTTSSSWSDVVTTGVDNPETTGVDITVSSDDAEVSIDWSLAFYYNDRVDRFTVYEDNVIVFEGFTFTRTARKGRTIGQTYSYHVSVQSVSGGTAVSRRVTHVFGLSTGRPQLTTSVSDVKSPQGGTRLMATPQPQSDEAPIYESAGFIAGIAVGVVVVVFIVGAIIMRRSTPAGEQRRERRYNRSQIPYQDPSMWSRPTSSGKRGLSPATSERALLESDMPMAWDTGILPSESMEDHKGLMVDPTSLYYADAFVGGEHMTFKDTHL